MNFLTERLEGLPCLNKTCPLWSAKHEQYCSGSHERGPFVKICGKYNPEIKKAEKKMKYQCPSPCEGCHHAVKHEHRSACDSSYACPKCQPVKEEKK